MRAVRLTISLAAPVLFLLVPTSCFETGHSLCLFKNLFGAECPGCGMTRALSAMVHGDIPAAFGYNWTVIVVFPLLCFILAKNIAGELKGTALLGAARRIRQLRARA